MQYRCLSIVLVLAACGDNHNTATPDAPTAPAPDAPAQQTPDAAVDAPAGVDFTETYEPGTQDVGDWILTFNTMRARMINTTGGNPDGYLYGEVATSIPGWYTESTHYDPGNDDSFKRDSVFVGDYYTAGIQHIGVDLDIMQVGVWTSDRTVTLELRSWDATDGIPGYVADYSLPDMDSAPVGWNHYDFEIDARSPTIPTGWTLLRPDGSPGTDEDWATLMHSIDMVAFNFFKPGYGYPSLGSWDLGIDNVHITAQ